VSSCYIDLLVRPRDAKESSRIVEAAGRLGYCILGIEGPDDVFEAARSQASQHGLRVVRVYTAPGAKRAEIARSLESAPRGKVLRLAVPKAADAARYAGANKKLAGFVVEPGQERLVDRSTRRLFMERGWGIVVVPLVHLVRDPYSLRTWKYYYVALRRGYAYSVDLALASGARDAGELWYPYSAAGVGELVGVPWEASILWLTSSPARILEKYLGERV